MYSRIRTAVICLHSRTRTGSNRQMQASKEINICNALLPKNYLNVATQALNTRENAIKELLEKRKLPLEPWPEPWIEELVHRFSAMDSNNFINNLGFGEREARVVCPLVARRHYHLSHGIGRSGNLIEAQPKAAGSSLMANLVNALLLDLMQSIAVNSSQRWGVKSCILVPMATGMTLMLCMLSFKRKRKGAKYVLWSRIDQKSCFKSITTAGLIPIIIETQKQGDHNEGAFATDSKAFEEKIIELGAENIVCLVSTTSCFAPRSFDAIDELAILAKKFEIPHLVNNAYGLQCKSIVSFIERAHRVGRVDLFVQSTDKNLMVPVGGAIVAGYTKEAVHGVAEMYAGRASSSQTLDALMTLLSLGKNGYKRLMDEREANFKELRNRMQLFADKHGTFLHPTSGNDISIALNLKHLEVGGSGPGAFGAMLYSRGVSGARVVVSGETKNIEGYEFQTYYELQMGILKNLKNLPHIGKIYHRFFFNLPQKTFWNWEYCLSLINSFILTDWGSHSSTFDGAYLTVAAAIGLKARDIPKLIAKLEECTESYLKQQRKPKELLNPS